MFHLSFQRISESGMLKPSALKTEQTGGLLPFHGIDLNVGQLRRGGLVG